MTSRQLPNIRATVRMMKHAPPLPPEETVLEIRMKDTRFRVRDEGGHSASAILADLSAPSSLGAWPHTIEKMMDIVSRARTPPRGATEFWGDLATGIGFIAETGQPPWQVDAATIAPAALQILGGAPRVPLPYVISDVRDPNNPRFSFIREIVAFEEGVVTDAELAPPVTR